MNARPHHEDCFCDRCEMWDRTEALEAMSFNKSGSKYLRRVVCIDGRVDVYSVLEAFDVRCPARAHAIKKLLCAGIRGKGNTLQDLREARDAVDRAIQMQEDREKHEPPEQKPEKDPRDEALRHIHSIMREKNDLSMDLECGSTAYKSVLRWADTKNR